MTALLRPGHASGLRARVRTGDPHVRLAVGLAVPACLVPIVAGDNAASIGMGALYLLVQLVLGLAPARRVLGPWQHPVRLVVAVAFVVALTGVARGGLDRPFTALYLPIVALAASIGLFEAVVIGSLAVAAVLLPLLTSFDLAGVAAERALMMASASAVLTIGTRRTINILERQGERLRNVVRRDRRRARQIAGIEAVGDVLAANGPTTDSLDAVVSLLGSNFGYPYVSIYLRETDGLRLGAQLGYPAPLDRIPAGRGILGRVVASGELAFLADVSGDPDYIAGRAEVGSEICAPLLVDGRVFGVLNVESDLARPLDQTDVATVRLVADRLAAAVALGAGRAALEARANSLSALIAFSRGLAETLDEQALYERIARSVGSVVPADIAIVTVRRGARYVLSAQSGLDDAPWVGIEIMPGEGMAGRAIAARTIVSDDAYGPNDFPRQAPRDTGTRTRLLGVAVPLLHDDEVVGAVSLFRYEVDRTFTDLELETLGALGAHAAVAIINAQLHAEVAESAVRDPLTGLFNRRHFDAAVVRLFAARQRRGAEEPIAVVMFDLDQFGQVNKDHGHAFGDDVLRAFGALLASRFRRSDLVARYGGEEFVAVLEGSTADDAKAVAEEIRERFARLRLHGVTGEPLGQTVSAGVVGEGVGDADPQALFATVDVALSVAKRAGRNQVVRF
jgi:diguanylate cyclase (GGDEF)-like protein